MTPIYDSQNQFYKPTRPLQSRRQTSKRPPLASRVLAWAAPSSQSPCCQAAVLPMTSSERSPRAIYAPPAPSQGTWPPNPCIPILAMPEKGLLTNRLSLFLMWRSAAAGSPAWCPGRRWPRPLPSVCTMRISTRSPRGISPRSEPWTARSGTRSLPRTLWSVSPTRPRMIRWPIKRAL